MQRYKKGFGIIDSMIALTLLSAVTLGIVRFNANNNTQKDAKILSTQTEAFAIVFAKYMSVTANKRLYFGQAQNSTVTLSPESLGDTWPRELAKKNRYGQTPCVAIIKNPDTQALEAIMYYVGGKIDNSANSLNLVRSAAVALGGIGGILSESSIQGNSGWHIGSSSPFLSGASSCGGKLAMNSLAVNLDLLPEWNQILQPLNSVLRGNDKTEGIQSLPGRIRNVNTLKSNIYFNPSSGIILDNSNSANPTKLSVSYYGQRNSQPALGLGTSVSTKLISDSLQPDLFFKAGDLCVSSEEGKTVADEGFFAANNVLSRGTLVCSQNDLICGSRSYCYVSSTPNQITFQNTMRGIQNTAGEFICPKAVPFAINAKTGLLGSAQVYTVINTGGSTSPNIVTAVLNKGGLFTRVINCPPSGCSLGIRTDYKSGIIDGVGELISVDLASVSGEPVGSIPAIGNSTYQLIQGRVGNYTTPIGYTVSSSTSSQCTAVCGSLNQVLGNKWQLLGTQRLTRINANVGIDNQHLGCACERTDFAGANPDNYKGIAFVLNQSVQPIILSATCSNMPLYNKN